MIHENDPKLGDLMAGCGRWWAVYTLLFVVTFPWSSGWFVAALRFVLEGLDSFGSGY